MGQLCVGARYNNVYEFEPKLQEWKSDFDALQFKQQDIGRLYRIYNKIDGDKSGLIDYVEMLTFLDIERTPFSKRVFTMFDEDGSGKLDFKEFVMSLWNYCTLSKSTLILFAFDIYDKDSSGEIEGKEVHQMLCEIYGKNYKNNTQALSISKEIDTKLGDVDIEELKEFSRTHPALLFPAFHMQQLIQKGTLGEQFWKYYSNRRIELSKGQWIPIGEFMTIHVDKDLKAELTTNVEGKKLNKKTLEIIEKTGSAADRRMSKVAVTDHDEQPRKKSIAAAAHTVIAAKAMHHPEELFNQESKSNVRRTSITSHDNIHDNQRRKSMDKNDLKPDNLAARRGSLGNTKLDLSNTRRRSFDKEDDNSGRNRGRVSGIVSARRKSFEDNRDEHYGQLSGRRGSASSATTYQ